MPLSKYKIIYMLASGLLAFLIFVSPVIVAAGIVAVPVVAINELFKNIGDFLFGSDANEVIKLINQHLKSDDTKQVINTVYKPLIDAETEINISLHWLIIPNLLAGIENVEEAHVQTQITLIKEVDSNLETYINRLRLDDPWRYGFASVSTTTIVGYINQYTNYLGQEGSLDIGDLKEEEFLYPLQTRAIVTSEFGTRLPITLPNGQVTNQEHTGIDLAYPGGEATTCGVPIYAAMAGEVVANERTQSQAGANWGSIRYKNLEVWYVHLRDPFPYEVGTQIKKGQFVGYIGSSGLSTACHLHLETHVNNKAINPRNFLDF